MKITKVFLTLPVMFLIFLTYTSVAYGYGSAPGLSAASAPVCTNAVPAKPWLYRVKSLGSGQYELFWGQTDKATSFTVGYGIESGRYIYGVHKFGNADSRSIVINAYTSRRMYFVVRANNDCMPGPWSEEWKVGSVVATDSLPVGSTPEVIETPAEPLTQTFQVQPTVQAQLQATVRPSVAAVKPAPTPAKTGGFLNWLKGLFGLK